MRFKYFIISLKQNIFTIILLLFTISLIIFSTNNLTAARNGLTLWAKFVVPTLFPFFVATELMLHTNFISILGKLFNPIMLPIFKVPGISAFAFLMGCISGYPVGAKIVTSLRNSKSISKDEGERLLVFTNNSGPLFIIATVGIGLFGNSMIGFLLLITHLFAAISVGILTGFCSKKSISKFDNIHSLKNNNKSISFESLGEILSKSILNSINTLLLIGGFVVLFSVIISILIQSGLLQVFELIFIPIFNLFNINVEFIKASVIGLLEVTNGINAISSIHIKNISTNIIFTAFILGFGGLSVTLQILSVISKSDLSIKPYIAGKLLQGTFATFYTYIFLCSFNWLNFDLTDDLQLSIIPILFFLIVVIFLVGLFAKSINNTDDFNRLYTLTKVYKLFTN